MSAITSKKMLLFGFLAVLLAVIPLTVFFLRSQTRTESGATAATTLCFSLPESNGTCLTDATPVTKNVGEKFTLDIYLDPKDTNKIVVATISINYDATKLEADPAKDTSPDKNEAILGFSFSDPDPTSPGFTQNLVAPAYTAGPPGNASVTRSVGTDALKAITQKTKIGKIRFKALTASPDGIPITFDSAKSNATSTLDPEVNVLSTTQPALVKIAQAGTGPTNTPVPTQPVTTVAPTVAPTIAAGTPKANQIPICSSLNVDRTTSGPSPFSINFTANGNDPDGTISKVTFDFGDGPVQDVTTGGGIGSKTVSLAAAHTYKNAGTYTAKATLTDNSSGLSAAGSTCTQTITVTQGTEVSAITLTPTTLPQKTFTQQPGPGDTILGIGIAGVVLTIIGTLLFFAL